LNRRVGHVSYWFFIHSLDRHILWRTQELDSLRIGQSDVRYRILASDAVSSWHTLSARPRPRVIEFAKTIVPPAYTGLPETKLTEEHGDVEAFEGSTLKLALKANQPKAPVASR
jgi:hypothetical protein